MRRTTLLLFSLILLCLSTSAHAQLWSGILDPSRAIDWSTAGIPGGIPNRTTICSSLAASTYGNGASDATAGIQAALNSCPANQVVSLSAGTFRINSSLTIPSNKVLRGAGPAQTIFDLHGLTTGAINFGAGSQPSAGISNAITGGAAKGSTSITVSGGGIAVGQLMVITQNDLSYMTNVGDGGVCSWCNGGIGGDSGQVVRVTNVNGGTITFTPPLYMGYTNSPVAYPYNAGGTNIGLESLQLYANNTGYTTNILLQGVTYSWVYNVESNFADGDHMHIYYGLGNVVSHSYFHDGFNHGPGTTDDMLGLAYKSSANLIVNNIFYRQHVSVMLEWGASGNVIAYNYSTGTYQQAALSWLMVDFAFHGAHPMMNLFEGNVGVQFQPDSYWGSSSHSTLFRDFFLGSSQFVPPLNSRGPLQPQNAVQQTSNALAYAMDWLSQFNNMVGTIAGAPSLLAGGAVSKRVSPAAGGGSPACIQVGYSSYSGGAHTPNNADTTMFYHGVYNCVEGSFQWDPGHPNHTLPASFFLSSKPAWWGNVPWPAIGPDVTGGNMLSVGGHAYKIPAQLCLENSPKDANDFIIFNPTTCYKGSGGPAPPTGLRLQ